MKRHQNLSRWLLRLILYTGIGIQLNGCVMTSPELTEGQLAANAFPEVDFNKPAPVQVDYADDREILLSEIIAVLDELGEEIDKIDRANYVITTNVRKYAQLVRQMGNQSDPSNIYQSTFKLTVVEKGTGVGMETSFSKEKQDSGQFVSGSNIVRQLFFHQLNSRLMPFLFTFRDGGQLHTRSVVDVLNLKVIKYLVKRNETLSMIASKYTANTSNWKAIAAINGIKNPKKLIAGQEILLPVNLLSECYRQNGIIHKLSPAGKKKVKVVKPQGHEKILKDDQDADCFGCN